MKGTGKDYNPQKFKGHETLKQGRHPSLFFMSKLITPQINHPIIIKLSPSLFFTYIAPPVKPSILIFYWNTFLDFCFTLKIKTIGLYFYSSK